VNEVDIKRVGIAKKLNGREKAAFMVGLGYFKAFSVAKEIQMGVLIGVQDKKMLDDVNWALEVLGEPKLLD
jgi:hypothetical protein